MLDWAEPHREEAAAAIATIHDLVEETLPPGCVIGQALIAPLGTCDLIGSYRGPVLVLHGALDFLVPIENAKRNYAGAKNASEREMMEIQADHNSCAAVPQFWKKQMDFIRAAVNLKRKRRRS
eukprot:gnl/TRDRNA2_/TRDRNA2_134896_c0_seq1.p1 gnl/TRDRNA2_/TRDRNA2_134896_c0~~gnl/TRDRNA2_/TRDRNA2_134896_c0_seq1.p1  ORF type:complete len:123 (+),score=22.82 gnl/TRDRNA2_/TRDRNA2_134896_c0_seq1:133-501(+)